MNLRVWPQTVRRLYTELERPLSPRVISYSSKRGLSLRTIFIEAIITAFKERRKSDCTCTCLCRYFIINTLKTWVVEMDTYLRRKSKDHFSWSEPQNLTIQYLQWIRRMFLKSSVFQPWSKLPKMLVYHDLRIIEVIGNFSPPITAAESYSNTPPHMMKTSIGCTFFKLNLQIFIPWIYSSKVKHLHIPELFRAETSLNDA